MARRRSSWLFYAILGLIVCALPVGYFLLLDRPEVALPPPGPVKAAPSTQDLHISDLTGTVQIRRPGAEWTQATKGQPLQAADAVRTADGSNATWPSAICPVTWYPAAICQRSTASMVNWS